MSFPKPPWDEAQIRAYFARDDLAPRYSALLGFEFLDVSVEEMWFECRFNPGKELCSPWGAIQGGFVTAMLDDTMSLAAISTVGFDGVVPTLEMKTSFFAPVMPGPVKARGKVLKRGKKSFFTEGRLYAPDGTVTTHATATCIHRPHDQVKRDRARQARGEAELGGD